MRDSMVGVKTTLVRVIWVVMESLEELVRVDLGLTSA